MRVVSGTAWARNRTAETVSGMEFQNLESRGGVSATAIASEVASTVDRKSVEVV